MAINQNRGVDASEFQGEKDGKKIELFTLQNSNGMMVQLSNLGARIVSIIVQNSLNEWIDVVVGANSATEYLSKEEPYYGAVIGPFTGRISNAQFNIKDKTHHLFANNGVNTLHGGPIGLHHAIWDTKLNDNKIQFTYHYNHQDEGFPGPIDFSVTYTLTEDNQLIIDYVGDAHQPTIINLTNHAYFNLDGAGSGKIDNHMLQINSDTITTLAEDYTQTGEFLDVTETPFDFRTSKSIGQSIEDHHQQLKFGNGYDHYFMLKKDFTNQLNHAATLKGNQSGITMEVFTSAQGVLLYTGNFMNDMFNLKNGGTDSFRTAVCLETQDFPDSINQPNFPSKIYDENNTYQSQTIFKFSN